MREGYNWYAGAYELEAAAPATMRQTGLDSPVVQYLNLRYPAADPEVGVFLRVLVNHTDLIVLEGPNNATPNIFQAFVHSIDTPWLPFADRAERKNNNIFVFLVGLFKPVIERHVLLLQLLHIRCGCLRERTCQMDIWRQTDWLV